MDEFSIEYGLTLEDFSRLSGAAKSLSETGDRYALLLAFGNQLNNYCKRNDVDVREVFQDIVNHLQSRLDLDGPHAPAEFRETYGSDDTE